MSNNTKGEVKELDIVDMPKVTGETVGVAEQRVPLTDTMKRTLTSLLIDRGEIDAALNDVIRMFVAHAGVSGTEFQLDLAAGVVIVKTPAERIMSGD